VAIARVAVVTDGIVQNIAIVDTTSGWLPQFGSRFVQIPDESRVSIGWLYNDVEFTDPTPPPVEVPIPEESDIEPTPESEIQPDPEVEPTV
jgi:hypothetical protein